MCCRNVNKAVMAGTERIIRPLFPKTLVSGVLLVSSKIFVTELLLFSLKSMAASVVFMMLVCRRKVPMAPCFG